MSASSATATRTNSCEWIELDDHCVVSFRGAAARSFIGRQLTCDLAALSPDVPQFGAWLTPKGRVLALLRLFDRAPERIDAVVSTALAEELIRRMRMFVMRDDVTIDVDEQQLVIGVSGDCKFTPQSTEPAIARISSHPPLTVLVGSVAALESARTALSASRGEIAQWRSMCIEAGLPQVGLSTREAFIPQMINLDRLEAVSFSKGCYPGQEIVARTQHLGRIKRRMFIVRASDTKVCEGVAPGTVLVGADGEDIGGRVVSVERSATDCVMLAILPVDSDTASRLVRIRDASGAAMRVFAPPYSLTDPAA